MSWARRFVVVASVVSLTGCTPSCQPAPDLEASVTCEGVRALRIGMAKREVVTLIGEGRPQGVNSDGTELWTYAEGQFLLQFDARDTLILATAGLSSMSRTEHPTRVFSLVTPGVAGEEGDQFERFFQCP